MRIRYKLTLLLSIIIFVATVPLSFFLIEKQKNTSLNFIQQYGKNITLTLARSTYNIYLMNGGNLAPSAVDAKDMIEGYSHLKKDGLLYGDVIIIKSDKSPQGKILASIKNPSYSLNGYDERNAINPDEIQLLTSAGGFREISIPGVKGKCYEFSSIWFYKKRDYPRSIGRLIYSKNEVLSESKTLTKMTTLALIITIFIAGLLSYFFSRYLTQPLITLTSAAKRIVSGDLSFTPLLKTGDEIEELSDTFAHMISTINKKINELAQNNRKLQQALQDHDLLVTIQNEIEMADEIQNALLPKEMPRIANCETAVRYIPMSTISGDFYNFYKDTEDSLVILIADVSGHGIPAALIGSKLDVSLRFFKNSSHNPDKLLSKMNTLISDYSHDQYITVCCIHINVRKKLLRYSNAGHGKLIIHHRKNQKLKEYFVKGTALGLFEDTKYTTKEISLMENDRIVLFTDGITDTRNPSGQRFGHQRLHDCIIEASDTSAEGCADHIIDNVYQFKGSPISEKPDDDIALVIFDVKL